MGLSRWLSGMMVIDVLDVSVFWGELFGLFVVD
jgi:hypothetical protein